MRRLFVVQYTTDPYWVKFYDWLHKTGRFELFVAFIEENENRSWNEHECNFRHILPFKKDPHLKIQKSYWKKANDLFTKIENFKPELIICCGYNKLFHWLINIWALRNKTPFILQSDSNVASEFQKNFILKFFKWIYLQIFLKGVKLVWHMGRQNKLYWQYYGLDQNRLVEGGYYPVDVHFFAEKAEEAQKRKEVIKKQFGINEKNVILFVGRFIQSKGLDLLVDAFARLANKNDCALILIGTGDCEQHIRQKSADIRNVYLLGPQKNADLPVYYGISDIYVQPSLYEPSGVVIHESLASGVPVIASDMCGYSYEMLLHGWNGFIFKSGNTDDLESSMTKLLADEELRRKMSVRAKELAMNWNFERIFFSLNSIVEKIAS